MIKLSKKAPSLAIPYTSKVRLFEVGYNPGKQLPDREAEINRIVGEEETDGWSLEEAMYSNGTVVMRFSKYGC